EPAGPVADEGTRDHPREPVRLADGTRRLAPTVEGLQRDLLLVRGDLEHAVRARVDDGLAGAQVLLAQLVEDDGAARGLVAEVTGRSGVAQPRLHQRGRKSLREGGEALLQDDAHHFPMAGGGVLALRLLRHLAEAGPRRRRWGAAGDRRHV